MRRLFVGAAALMIAMAAHAESAEKTAEEFVQLSTSQGASAAVILYHPNEVQRVRDKVLLSCEREAESGRKQVRAALFGAGVSLDDVRRMTPENLLLAIMAKLPARTTVYDEFKALGSVKEGENLHVVVRASLKKVERLKRRSVVQVVSLLPSGKEWRAAVPSGIEAYIDGVLAAAPEDIVASAVPATTAPGRAASGAPAAKDPAWSALLARGIDLLSRGNCLTYFLDVVEPGFSKTMSPRNFDAVVRGCELNEHTREKFRVGLELASTREPQVEQGGSRVTYDLSGEGLPYDHLTLLRVDGRWYVSE
jgi:hypothetical protein